LATEFSFTMDTTRLKNGPKEMDRKLLRAAYAVVKFHEGKTEAYMRQKAPWRDRTTNARNGLFSKAVKESARVFSLILAHTVTYGIYLERGTRHMRARPIIMPTIELYAPKVMAMYNKILNRL
jgi:HK97 gp10 family phage protein